MLQIRLAQLAGVGFTIRRPFTSYEIELHFSEMLPIGHRPLSSIGLRRSRYIVSFRHFLIRVASNNIDLDMLINLSNISTRFSSF